MINKAKTFFRFFEEYTFSEIYKKTRRSVLIKLGLKHSDTVFFTYKIENKNLDKRNSEVIIKPLNKEKLNNIKEINIFRDLEIEEIFNNAQFKIITAQINNEICGFTVIHFGGENIRHNINNWVYFKLDKNEAWIGPTFVSKQFRGKGINSTLLNGAKTQCKIQNVDIIYTCINSVNTSSIKSFKKNDFLEIGRVRKNKSKYQILNFQKELIDKII